MLIRNVDTWRGISHLICILTIPAYNYHTDPLLCFNSLLRGGGGNIKYSFKNIFMRILEKYENSDVQHALFNWGHAPSPAKPRLLGLENQSERSAAPTVALL